MGTGSELVFVGQSLPANGSPDSVWNEFFTNTNANLPESHDAAVGWSESGRPMTYSSYHKAELDYLQNRIDQGNVAATSAKPDKLDV